MENRAINKFHVLRSHFKILWTWKNQAVRRNDKRPGIGRVF